MMDGHLNNSSSLTGKKSNQDQEFPEIRTSPGFTKSYNIQDSRHSKKSGMVKVSILKYLKKRDVVDRQPPPPVVISNRRDSCVQTDMDILPSPESEKPEVEWLGTFPATSNPPPVPQSIELVKHEEQDDEEIIILPQPTVRNGSNNNVNGSSFPVLTPNNNLPLSTDHSSLNKASSKNNISSNDRSINNITSNNNNNTSTIITELTSFQNTENSVSHRGSPKGKGKSLDSVSPSRSSKMEEKENNKSNMSADIVQNKISNENSNNNGNDIESTMNPVNNISDIPSTNLSCHVMLAKEAKASDPLSTLQFLHKPSPSTLPSAKRKSLSEEDDEIEPLENRLNNKRQKTQQQEQVNGNTSADVENSEQCNNLVSPSKSIRSRRSSISSNLSSNSKRRKSEMDTLDFATLIDKGRFEQGLKLGIGQLINSPTTFTSPNAEQLSKILFKCILGRSNRDLSSLAIHFFELLVQVMPWSTENYDLFVETFVTKYTDSSTDSLLVIQLLESMKEDGKKKPEEKFKFQFFKVLTDLVEKDFHCYTKQGVKLRLPMAVSLMEQPQKFVDIRYNENWKTFVQRITDYGAESEEVEQGLKWVTIISSYYKNTRLKMESFNKLRDEFVKCLNNRNDLRDWGLQFIKLINFNPFALDLCTHIIRSRLSGSEDVQKWNKILYELSANIQPPSTSLPNSKSDLKSPSSISERDKQFEKYITSSNSKGETRLHKACAQKKIFIFQGKQLTFNTMLQRMKDYRIGDINIRDCALNTVLHDCAFYDRGDVLMKIWEYFTSNDDPARRVNVTAQNDKGDTALHIAVNNKSKTCIAPLLLMSKILRQEAELLCIRNNAGKKAFEMADEDDDEEMKNLFFENSNIITKKRRTMYAGVDLSNCISEIDSPSVQALIVYWRHLYDVNNPRKVLPKLVQIDDMMDNMGNDEEEGTEEQNGDETSSISSSS